MHPVRPVDPSFVLQRTQQGVVVSATHPALGRLYWSFISGADHNAPDYYSITQELDTALLLPYGWREKGHLAQHRSHVSKTICDEAEYQGVQCAKDVMYLGGMLGNLQKRSGQSPAEFASWLEVATWADEEAPACVQYLTNFNGLIGYAPEWSADAADALQFTEAEVGAGEDADDLDVMLAARLGKFVEQSTLH